MNINVIDVNDNQPVIEIIYNSASDTGKYKSKNIATIITKTTTSTNYNNNYKYKYNKNTTYKYKYKCDAIVAACKVHRNPFHGLLTPVSL